MVVPSQSCGSHEMSSDAPRTFAAAAQSHGKAGAFTKSTNVDSMPLVMPKVASVVALSARVFVDHPRTVFSGRHGNTFAATTCCALSPVSHVAPPVGANRDDKAPSPREVCAHKGRGIAASLSR